MPTADSVTLGRQIKSSIESAWHPPSYYYHLRSGGHVGALRLHLDRKYFLRIDLQDFFGSIGLGRVTRRLTERFGFDVARDWAKASTVQDPADKTRHILPFGFVQSPIIASLCLAKSALGKCIHGISQIAGVDASVYMDDVIISTDDASLCSELLDSIRHAAHVSAFHLNASKQQGPAPQIIAFNILLAHESLCVSEGRMRLFSEALDRAATQDRRDGVIAYVASINAEQAESFDVP